MLDHSWAPARTICTALGSDGQGPKGFSFVFLDLFNFFQLFADLARACLGFLERPSRCVQRSCEFVRVRKVRTIRDHRTGALLDRETGPDLTWQSVVVCGRP